MAHLEFGPPPAPMPTEEKSLLDILIELEEEMIVGDQEEEAQS